MTDKQRLIEAFTAIGIPFSQDSIDSFSNSAISIERNGKFVDFYFSEDTFDFLYIEEE